MKFTSTINNLKCIEWDLTLSQAFLVDLLIIAESWAKRETVDDTDYRWVSRNKILDEIPHAYKTADRVYRALKDLAEKDIIEYKKLGKKDLIRMTEKGKSWIFSPQAFANSELGFKAENDFKSVLKPIESGIKAEKDAEKSVLKPTDNGTNTNHGTKNNNTSKNNSKKKVDNVFFDAASYQLPSFVNSESWSDFVEMRQTIKKPLNALACKKAINVLVKLNENGSDANASLDNSVLNSYSGLFEVKSNVAGNSTANVSQQPVKQNNFETADVYHPSQNEFADSNNPVKAIGSTWHWNEPIPNLSVSETYKAIEDNWMQGETKKATYDRLYNAALRNINHD